MKKTVAGLLTAAASAALMVGGLAGADGTEALGPPAGITIASGTGVVTGGVGLGGVNVWNGGGGVDNQAASFTVDVPSGVTVKQVLLYWEGHHFVGTPGDNTISVNGNPVTGSLIGGPTTFFGDVQASTFRRDITTLNAILPGTNTVTVSGLANSYANNGAGVVVIYDDGGQLADIAVRDGLDLAYFAFAPPLDTTTPQSFSFAAEPVARTAHLGIFAGSVAPQRPNAIVIDVGGTQTKLVNPLFSSQGPEWDVVRVPVAIPAGATSLQVQVLSESDGSGRQPASLSWIVGTLSLPRTPPPPQRGPGTGTPGFWKNHPEAWPVASITIGGVTYTRAQAIKVMEQPTNKDVTYSLAQQLIAAKLNVLIGNDSSCISEAIAGADSWLTRYPVGSGVRGSSDAWRVGEPLKTRLDAYNNGLLCAPSRDS